MTKYLLLAMAVLLICGASGCMTLSGGIAPSTKPLDPAGYAHLKPASGTSWGFQLFGFIPLAEAATSEALDEALQDGGGDALVQVCVDNRRYWLILFTMQRIKVEGLAVRAK